MINIHWIEEMPDLCKLIVRLSDDDLRKELMKYPDVAVLRQELEGLTGEIDFTKIDTKEKLIDIFIENRRKSRSVSI